MFSYSLDFPFACGSPASSGDFRQHAEDFQVDEELGYQPDGAGEHVYLHICKRGENTAWVAEQIARLAKVKVSDIGYGGRKDRHAVTTQWFSVYFPKGQEPDWQLLNSDTVQLLAVARHSHKLRRGEHQRNHFVIRLRNVDNPQDVEERLKKISESGVPNYFGEQRFGRQGNNLAQAQSLLVEGIGIRDKQKRGLILSAARSYLFNQVLARRVAQGTWQQLLSGEVAEEPTGPLWGRGRSLVSGETLAVEQDALADWGEWCNALEHVGLNQDRRALQLCAENMSWRWLDSDLEVGFALKGGEFATAVLREVMSLRAAEA